jgi:hypothetical protein
VSDVPADGSYDTGEQGPMVVLVKTTATIRNLRLDKDEQQLDISCGGDLKVIVTVERAKTEGSFDCTAHGEATPPAEIARDSTQRLPQ